MGFYFYSFFELRRVFKRVQFHISVLFIFFFLKKNLCLQRCGRFACLLPTNIFLGYVNSLLAQREFFKPCKCSVRGPPAAPPRHETTLAVDEDKAEVLRLDTRRHATTHDKQAPLVMPNSVFLSLLICQRG